METIKLNVVDMSDRLNAEGKYCIKVNGERFLPRGRGEVILDASDLSIDQLGVIAGFLDAVFDDAGIDKLTGVSIVKPESGESKE